MRDKTKHENSLTNVSPGNTWLGKAVRMSLFVLFFIMAFTFESEATHYRYGNITWSRPSNTSRLVTFTITQAWRRSYPVWPGAIVGQVINPGINLLFGDGAQVPILLTVTSV